MRFNTQIPTVLLPLMLSVSRTPIELSSYSLPFRGRRRAWLRASLEMGFRSMVHGLAEQDPATDYFFDAASGDSLTDPGVAWVAK